MAFGVPVAIVPALIWPPLWLVWCFALTFVLLTLLADALMTPGQRDLTHRIDVPRGIEMGHPETLTLGLSLARQRSIHTDLRLDLSDGLAPLPRKRAILTDLPLQVPFQLVARRRGMAEIEALWTRFVGPLGLIQRTVRIDLSRPIDAVPSIRTVRQLAVRFLSPSEQRTGVRVEKYLGDGSEFDSLREFQAGMDRRTLDWKHSARHHRLLSRKFRAERNRQIVIAIDTGHLMREPIDGMPRLDHALHAGLVLAYVGLRVGDRVGLHAFDDRIRSYVKPRAGMPAFRGLLKVSSGLAYGESETNYTLGLTDLMTRLNRRSLVVVLTDFVDTVTAGLMVDNLHRISRRHVIVFVSLRDPSLTELAERPPADVKTLTSAVVADSLLRERELVLTRLKKQGVFCIDAAPEEIGVQLLNRYLDIRRRELIG